MYLTVLTRNGIPSLSIGELSGVNVTVVPLKEDHSTQV
jgi:hypothetical protein